MRFCGIYKRSHSPTFCFSVSHNILPCVCHESVFVESIIFIVERQGARTVLERKGSAIIIYYIQEAVCITIQHNDN